MSIEIKHLVETDFPQIAELYPWPGDFWIRANFAQSLNGKVTDDSKLLYLATEKDKFLFRYLRATADCLIIGRQTAISQPYQEIKLSKKYLPLRHTYEPLQLVLVSNSLEFPPGFFANFNHKPLLVTNQNSLVSHSEILPWVEPIILGEVKVDLNLLKSELIKRGYLRVLCEGGPDLVTSLVNFDLIDEIDLTVSNQLVASSGKSILSSNLKTEKIDFFYFEQVLYDQENLFMRILKK